MDFVKITEDFVQEEEEQIDDIGFIENNKFYNKTSLNKRVFPPEKLLERGSTNFLEKNQTEKKKVTYDDILSSLNMKVINGKLQIVRGDADAYSQPPQNPYNRNRMGNGNGHLNTAPKNINTPNHAYAKQNEFYNKFLQAQTQVQAPVVAEALTPEEKKRILMIQYIKQQQQRQHISRVKSRKLSFV